CAARRGDECGAPGVERRGGAEGSELKARDPDRSIESAQGAKIADVPGADMFAPFDIVPLAGRGQVAGEGQSLLERLVALLAQGDDGAATTLRDGSHHGTVGVQTVQDKQV